MSRRSLTLLAVSALVTGGLVAGSSPAMAVHELSMQLDGNTTVEGTGPAYDWESFFTTKTGGDLTAKTSALPAGFLARGSTVDYALPEYSTFATGSKDTLNIGKTASKAAGWQCGKSNNLGAKDDLMNVYTVAYRNPADQHLILYFGAEKASNLGDNNVGIWFLQDGNVGCTAGNGNTDFSGHHVKGDVLLTAAFTNGGTVATVEARTWKNGADNGGEGLLSNPDSGFLCGSSSNDKACAITNLANINPPWNHPAKTAAADGSLLPQEFYEGGVDVTQLQIDAGNVDGNGNPLVPCITTFLADTRSSQSPTATLFDYAAGSFPVCRPATSLTVSRSPATIHSGDSVTWTAVESNTGTSPISNVAVVDAAASGACSPFAYVSGDTNSNGKLDPAAGSTAAEAWTFTCTQALTASRTINVYGTGTDVISGKTVAGGPVASCAFDDTKTPPAVTTQATGFVCDPNERATASVTVIHPSTLMTNTAATASPTTAHAGDNVTFTFYEKNDGDVDLTSPSVTTDDAGCTPAYASGDSDTDGVLDQGEEWAFTCVDSFSSAGSKTVTATGHGTDPLNVDVTYYGSPCTAGVISTGRFCDLQERTSASVTIINPSTNLRENASAVVTFTYSETNDGDSPITNVTVDSSCSAPGHSTPSYKTGTTLNVGDTNNDGKLSPGETWTFTCTKSVTITSGNTVTYTDSSTGHGTDSAGGTLDNTTDTDEADSSTVTVTNNAPN